MFSKPKISVLLPVYNAARFLPETLASLAGQTYRDFEVVAIDGGSTDGSGEMLRQFAQKHAWLRAFHREHAGQTVDLNYAFAESRGELIARMDADDIADRHRFARQVEFLQADPAIGVCGSWSRKFGDGQDGVVRAPITDDAIRSWLVFGSALVSPAVMMRREVLQKLTGPYLVAEAEDYDLWVRLAATTRFHNLPRVLLHYRCHPNQLSRTTASLGERVMRIRLGLLDRLGIHCSAREQRAHAALGFEVDAGERPQPPEVVAWLERLCAIVPATGWCSEKALRADGAEAWWRFMRAGKGGFSDAWAYGQSPVAGRTPKTFFRVARLALR